MSTSDKIAVIAAIGTCVSAVIALISAIVAIIALRRARDAEDAAGGHQATAEQHSRRATEAAEEAVTAQKRSAAAAEKSVTAQTESADAAKRSAEALEKANQMAEEIAAAAEGVPWRIEHRSGAQWELWNESDHPKFWVDIAGPGVSVSRPFQTLERLDGRSCAVFWGNNAYGSQPLATVTWHRRIDRTDNPPPTWTGTMPPER